jgi:hypothetical protein
MDRHVGGPQRPLRRPFLRSEHREKANLGLGLRAFARRIEAASNRNGPMKNRN